MSYLDGVRVACGTAPLVDFVERGWRLAQGEQVVGRGGHGGGGGRFHGGGGRGRPPWPIVNPWWGWGPPPAYYGDEVEVELAEEAAGPGEQEAVLAAVAEDVARRLKISPDGRKVTVVGVGDTRPMDEYARTVEGEFLAMKALAERAKWPSDLSSKIVEIDRAWQEAKADANAAQVSVVRGVGPDSPLRRRIREMTATLNDRLGVGSGVPTYAWVLGGAAAVLGTAAAWFASRRPS